jgi:hypothetical protein
VKTIAGPGVLILVAQQMFISDVIDKETWLQRIR